MNRSFFYCIKINIGYSERTSASESPSVSSQEQVHGPHTRVSSDLIGALLKRGEKLREAMVTTADEDNELDEPGVLGAFVERSVALVINGLI